jgi:hypothetical protein
MNGTTATILRKPINRLISAFLFNDIMLPMGFPNGKMSG